MMVVADSEESDRLEPRGDRDAAFDARDEGCSAAGLQRVGDLDRGRDRGFPRQPHEDFVYVTIRRVVAKEVMRPAGGHREWASLLLVLDRQVVLAQAKT